MTQSSLFLDVEIAYYQTLSKFVQYKRNFLENKIRIVPNKILVKEIHA